MFPDYDDHLGSFDDFNKEIFIETLGFVPIIKEVFIASELLIKYDFIEEDYYIVSSIPLYITIKGESKDFVYLVLLNEDVYLDVSYATEHEFNIKINKIETTIKNSLFN